MFRSRVFLVVLAFAAAFSLPASATELPLGGAGGTYSDGTRTRGYWFVAPVTFTIDALRVPNVGGGPQNLQVMTLPSNPPTYSSTTTNYTTLFYTNSGSSSASAWVPVNVTINAGQVVGILGARGTGTMHNAYANSSTFTSNIAGNSITLRRFGTQVNLHNQQAGPVWTESYTYSRVEMDYSVGPVALAGGAYSGVEGSGILVDGSGSTGATSYAWDCDTNGVNDCSGSNATCACVYPDQGVYTATLVVTGSLGTDTDTAVVTVSNVPPSAVTIGGPSTGTEGSSLAFTGSAVDVPADPITYSWTFGDGGTSNVQNPSHTYADDGTYTVTLTASDGDGGSASTTTSVVVSNANPAITSLTSNAPQSEGSPIAFTTAVTDPGTLDTHTYAWTFGDGTTGTGANPSHIYGDDGTYPVTVIVTDDDGGTATASINVTVTNSPPTAVTISGPTSGTEGSPLSFVGSAVDVSADPITYFWSFGDGGTATVQSPTHTYADDGTYTVTLTASDGDGGSTAVTASVVISNANPTITVLTSNAPQDEGTPTTFATTITDAGVLDTHTYAWTFGDGATGTGANPSHTYANDGTYSVSLTVTDDDGGTDTATLSVTVNNVAPTGVVIGGPSSGTEGSPLAFTGSATDPGADTITYSWTFGDGGTSTVQNPTHTYADDGSYTVTLTATDDDGASTSATTTVVITNANPVVASLTSNGPQDEGSPTVFATTITDAGVLDTHTYAWTFGDGTTGTGANPSHTYADDGTYNVSLTVTDDDGGTATSTISVTVNNANPVIASLTSNAPQDEGSPTAFTTAITDAGVLDTHTYAWTFDDGTTGTGANPNHTYADDGTYSVSLTVTDDDGGTATATLSVTVNNANPVIASLTSNAPQDEGSPTAFATTITDAGVLDTHTYAWTFGDGAGGTGANPSHTYADDGTYTVSLTVTDDDGGTATSTISVTVNNVNPVITSMASNAPQDEGSPMAFTSTITDVGVLDTHTYAWSFGDGSNGTGANPSHTFLDDGTYTVSLTVTDDDGGTATSTISVTVNNVAPSIATVSGPTNGDEGSSLSFVVAGSDPGSVDQANLTYSWAWDDGTADGVGSTPSHAWDDEGTYNVVVTVTDPQGAAGTSVYTVTIANVAPSITTVPPGFASEGVVYSYTAVAADPGADTLTWSISPSAPPTMTVDSATGLVEWTPGFGDVGNHPVTLTVDDGDGGTDAQTWTLQVGFVDDDGDGMADTWETDNGLDPGVDDSAGDPDGDGRPNIQEFLDGTDPNVWDGPTDPVPTYPIGGEEIAEARPDLVWDDSVSPPGDPITYDVEVYEDAAGTLLVTSATEIAPGSGGSSTWELDLPLDENGTYWWQVRADDSYTTSNWSVLEPFFVNEVNEAPDTPVPLWPIDGETVATVDPSPEWADAFDPDQDVLGYRVRVWDADGTTMLTEGLIAIEARDVSWQLDVALDEDTWYEWEVLAFDEDGLESDWSEPEPFFVDTDNAAPGEVVWINPTDGDNLETTTPVLTAGETTDPEASELTYVFRLDTSNGFESEDLLEFDAPHTDTGEVSVDLEAEGVELLANTQWFGRVRAEDEAGLGGPWAEIAFFIRGDNDPPDVPLLEAPADGETVDTAVPIFVVIHSEDPDGDTVSYEIRVTSDREGTVSVTSVDGLLGGTGPLGDDAHTSWVSTVNLSGTVYWTARAVDERGAASDWAEPWSFTVPPGSPGITLDPESLGCECQAQLADARGSSALALALLPLGLLLRRRR